MTDKPEGVPPKQPRLLRRATLICLVLSVVFCGAALLFYFRVTPAPYIVLKRLVGRLTGGALPSILFVLWPVLALVLGLRLRRARSAPRLSRWAVGVGGFLVLLFGTLLGAHFVKERLGPQVPQNPSAPSPVPSMVGLPVFPGAEGFGTRTPAGRGGRVLLVTS